MNLSVDVETTSIVSNGTTTTQVPPLDEDDSLFVIIPVVVILILVILSLMVYFMIKQRRLIQLRRDILAMYEFDPCEEEWESLSNSFNTYNYGIRNYNSMASTRNSSGSRNSVEETTIL